jgi:hypothetical protein
VHWREIRDQALLDLADELAHRLPVLQQAQIVRSAIRRYASSRWAAVDEVKAADEAALAARRRFAAAVGATETASYRHTAHHDRLEAELRQTADLAIGAFRSDMLNELY